MNEERRIEVEQVDAVAPPPKARVEMDDARGTFERKRDYLEGFLAHKPEPDAAGGEGGALQAAVVEALKDIYDPEIPVNIYDLGLIYGVDVTADGHAVVTMTLTTPHCPVAESMPGEVELRVGSVPGIGDAEVNLVWDPPWDPSKMSDEAQARTGNAMMAESKLRQRPAALTLTASAEARIAELMARAPEGTIGVKLSTRGAAARGWPIRSTT